MSSKNLVDLRGRNTRFRAERLSGYSPQPERQAPLRTRRKRARLIAFFLIIVGLCVITYEIHALSYSPRFTIQSIKVVGEQLVPPETIEGLVHKTLWEDGTRYIARANIFTYPGEEVRSAILDGNPRIRAVNVYRASLLSNELVVEVHERQPFAKACVDGVRREQCYQIDDTGFLFAPVSSSSPVTFQTHYTFIGDLSSSTEPIRQTIVPGHLRGLSALADLLGQSHYTVDHIMLGDENDFSAVTDSGLLLKFSYGSNADMLVKNLDLVFSSDALRGKKDEVEYVDLRFGNRVYYKLKGEAERLGASQ